MIKWFIYIIIILCILILLLCRFRQWVDECSQLFGGLDMVGVQAIVGKDGREYILEVCATFIYHVL